ncbi:putative transcriptional regulator [Thaumarchaeota archaeon SCGC AB-539-E09]|nr:putative transcriptional regulator [Thaumarchaeota archaeon SCGC AB-539-E09]
MPNITLSVSNEMKERMDQFTEVSWSDVCRYAIREYLEQREKDIKITDSEKLKVLATIDIVVRRRENKLVYLLKIKNIEDFNIILDRVIFGVQYNFEDKQHNTNDYPHYFFDMTNISSGEIYAISSFDNLDDKFKQKLYDLVDEERQIQWAIHGSIFYRSKSEIYKTGFHTTGILSKSIRDFIHDQMRI